MKLEFSLQLFEKYYYIKFLENPSVRAKLLLADKWMDGRTDTHDETNSCFSQFCKCA